MEFAELREIAWQANQELHRRGLAPLTWGNASAADRTAGVFAIKPSGVAYEQLRMEDIVVVALDDGRVVSGRLRPSSDTPTHRALYLGFPEIGGVVHTHALHATAWAQLGRPLPCLGTTHADHFRGAVPVARELTEAEIAAGYEAACGAAIVETFRRAACQPLDVPAVFLAGHGPFTWGASASDAVRHAEVLEAVARMALLMGAHLREVGELAEPLRRKHFERKHGPKAYYGQEALP